MHHSPWVAQCQADISSWTGDVAHLLDRLPSIYEALGFIHSTENPANRSQPEAVRTPQG
ncbi:hypothetical protein ACRRTK_016465 [Alexandromys fortis]